MSYPEERSDLSLGDFVTQLPVIYADGVRDDTAGLMAAVQNKTVLYDGVKYMPGEPINVDRWMHFALDNVIVIGEGDELPSDVGPDWIVIRAPEDTREIQFLHPDEDFDPAVDEVVDWGSTPAIKRHD